jgi:hypothetical protein
MSMPARSSMLFQANWSKRAALKPIRKFLKKQGTTPV